MDIPQQFAIEKDRHARRMRQIENRSRAGMVAIAVVSFLVIFGDFNIGISYEAKIILVAIGSWLMAMALAVFIGLVVHQRLKENNQHD